LSERVNVYEVAPRDGLQNESTVVETDDKVAFIERLVASGYRDVEISSFVRPRWVPQLADASEVVARTAHLRDENDVTFWALVPNRRGLDRAVESGLGAVATFLSASETHNKKNINRTVRESLAAQSEVIASAREEGMRVRAYISCVFGCPYEGHVDPDRAVDIAQALLSAGAEQISLGDTTGMGNPAQVADIIGRFKAAGVDLGRLALHMHDTRGTALANVLAGLQSGVRCFDASIAGLGGCPYAPGASGNLASEDLIYMLQEMGYDTGLDLESAAQAGDFIEDVLGRELPGRYHLYHRGAAGSAGSASTASTAGTGRARNSARG